MTRREIIDLVRAKAYCTKEGAENAIDALLAELTARLRETGSAALPGFGSFKVSKRGARMGRNPRTGEALRIKASNSVRFKPAKALKDSLQEAEVVDLAQRRRRKTRG
jgi:nucleoid DNA-binding protein